MSARWAVGVLLLALVSAVDAAGARLVVTTPTPQFGRPVNVELLAAPHGGVRPEDLDALDLTPLDRDFVVEPRARAAVNPDTGDAVRRLRLLPRHSGELALPGLALAGTRDALIPPSTLTVAPAVDRKDGAPLQVGSHVDDGHVWLHQGVNVRMTVESHYPNVRLAVETPELADVEIEPLAETRSEVMRHGVALTRLEIGWRLYPTRPGTVSVQLPAVELRRDGGLTHRFPPPRVTLETQALPAFVPPTLAVGRIEVDAILPTARFLHPQELAFLELRIAGAGAPHQQPLAVLRQLKGDAGLTVYPPEALPPRGTDDAHTRRYRVPFTPTRPGLVELPRLRLQYFDPGSGKIVTRRVELGRVLSVPPALSYLAGAVLLVALAWAARGAFRLGARHLRRQRAYRDALAAIDGASTPQQLRAALTLIAVGEGWPANLTLGDWLGHWRNRHPHDRMAPNVTHRLNAALYGRDRVEFDGLRSALGTLLRDGGRRRGRGFVSGRPG